MRATNEVSPEVGAHVQKLIKGLNDAFPLTASVFRGVAYIPGLETDFDKDNWKIRISTALTGGTLERAQLESSRINEQGTGVARGVYEAFDALVIHEYAHAIHFSILDSLGKNEYLVYMQRLHELRAKLGNPSEYATKDLNDWLAEQFTFEWLRHKKQGELTELLLTHSKKSEGSMKTTISLAASAPKVTADNAKKTYQMVKESLAHQNDLLKKLEPNKSHPQVAVTYAKTAARIEMLDAFERALRGQTSYLRLYTHD